MTLFIISVGSVGLAVLNSVVSVTSALHLLIASTNGDVMAPRLTRSVSSNNNKKKSATLPDDIKDKIAEHITLPISPKYTTALRGKQDVGVIKQYIEIVLALPPNAAQKPLQYVLEAIADDNERKWCLADEKVMWANTLSKKLRAMRRHFDKAVKNRTKWTEEVLADRGVEHVPDEADDDDEDEMDDQDNEGPTADLKATRKAATSTAGGPEPTPAPAGTQQSDGFYAYAWDAELQAACSYTYTHNILMNQCLLDPCWMCVDMCQFCGMVVLTDVACMLRCSAIVLRSGCIWFAVGLRLVCV